MKSLFNRPGFWMIVGPFEIMAFMWITQQWGYPQWAAPVFIIAVMIPQAVLQSLNLNRRIPDITMYSMMGTLVLSICALSIWKETGVYYPEITIGLGFGIALYIAIWSIRTGLHKRMWAALKATDWHEAEIANQLARHWAWQMILAGMGLTFLIGLFDVGGLVPLTGASVMLVTLAVSVVYFLSWWEAGAYGITSSTIGSLSTGSILTILVLLHVPLSGGILLGAVVIVSILFVLILLSYWEMEPGKWDIFWYR